MKKIMFTEHFGLQQSLLDGKKTMTRRLMTMTLHKKNGNEMTPIVPDNMFIASDGTAYFQVGRNVYMVPKKNQPAYKVGEEIVIAQSYKQCWDIYQKQWESYNDPSSWRTPDAILGDSVQETAGWTNKMFVKAEYMPHAIRIKSIKAERLQDISEEDAIREGIFKYEKPPLHHEMDLYAAWPPYVKPYKHDKDNLKYFCSARYAFAYLIDKVSGTGTWERNPWVFAYTFELVR